MVTREFCSSCKGIGCCNRTLNIMAINDEYSHLTNIIIDIDCDLYRYDGYKPSMAYGTTNPDIMFETDAYKQCNFCLYKSVCKFDPALVTRGCNDLLHRLKNVVNCRIACSSFHPIEEYAEKKKEER